MKIYKSNIPFSNKLLRFLWNTIWFLFARPFPARTFNFWKITLLKIFGAQIGPKSVVYSNASIYQPWNLKMGFNSCIASKANIYNVDKIFIGDNVTVSQGAFLCTASHDYTSSDFELITMPIYIDNNVWVAADAYINMGVILQEGCVIAARSGVYKNIEAWSVVGGNPCKVLKKRILVK